MNSKVNFAAGTPENTAMQRGMLASDMTSGEATLHWSAWCLTMLMLIGERVPTVVLVGVALLMQLYATRVCCFFRERLLISAISGTLIVNDLGRQVSQGWSIAPAVIGCIGGLFLALSPALLRFCLLSIGLGLCISPYVRTVLVIESLGIVPITYSSSAKLVIGLAEMVALGIPGMAYCLFEPRFGHSDAENQQSTDKKRG